MSFAARTVVEAFRGPAAITDGDGLVLVANGRWDGAPEGARLPDTDGACAAHARLLTRVRGTTRAGGAVELPCTCVPDAPVLVRIADLDSGCGAPRRLITAEAQPAGDAADAKQRFLALLGHEFRTPVTTVTATIDLLRAQEMPPEMRESVDTLHRSVHGLRTLIDDLLDLARLETGTLEPHYRPTPVRETLESVLEPLQHHTRQKGILLLAAPHPDLPATIEGDPDRLRQVLTAVVGNAVKFTEAGEVVVTAERDGGDRYAIVVSDTGPGIDPADRERIFAPFVQADSSASRRHEGAGMGLALAARLVERMGGTLACESEPGRGSVFTVRLPLRPTPTSAGPASGGPASGGPARRRIALCAPSPRAGLALTWLLAAAGAEAEPMTLRELTGRRPAVDGALWCDDAHDPAAAERADAVAEALGPERPALMVSTTDPRTGVVRRPGVLTAPLTLTRLAATLNQKRAGVRGAPVTVPSLPGGRVLLAEDNAVNRTVFRRMIELMGVECVAVGDGAAAASALLGDDRFDVALMDVQMPGVGGLEATRRVRAAGGTVPIVALTATALPEDRERCRAAGMDGYLSKPITLPELRQALARYLEGTAEPAAPEPAAPSDPVLSLDQLRDLEEQLDGRELVAMTVSTFLSELDGRRQALATALNGRDNDRLRSVAHTLKSSSGLLGAGPLAEACATVERLATADAGAEALTAAVGDADRLAVATAVEMRAYLSEPEPSGRS